MAAKHNPRSIWPAGADDLEEQQRAALGRAYRRLLRLADLADQEEAGRQGEQTTAGETPEAAANEPA